MKIHMFGYTLAIKLMPDTRREEIEADIKRLNGTIANTGDRHGLLSSLVALKQSSLSDL